jgi:hypothetical protein
MWWTAAEARYERPSAMTRHRLWRWKEAGVVLLVPNFGVFAARKSFVRQPYRHPPGTS